MAEPMPDAPALSDIGPAPIIPISSAAGDELLSHAAPLNDTRRLATLPGFLPEVQLRQLFQTLNFVDAPRTLTEIHHLWDAARQARQRLPRVPTPMGNIEGPLPPEYASYEQQLMRRDVYQRWYQPFFPYQLRLIALKRLVTPQYFIDRDYVDALAAHAPEPADMAGALAFAFEFDTPIPDPVLDGAGTLVIFRSAQTRLMPIQPLEYRRVGPHEYEVVQRIQTRPNLVQVARLSPRGADDRLIVVNGVHRAAALILKGWDYVPVLLRRVSAYAEIGFGPDPGIFPEAAVVHQRPPYVADFLDPTVATEFRQRVTEQGLKVGAQIEAFGLPA